MIAPVDYAELWAAAIAEIARLTAEVERLTRELDEVAAIRREEAL